MLTRDNEKVRRRQAWGWAMFGRAVSSAPTIFACLALVWTKPAVSQSLNAQDEIAKLVLSATGLSSTPTSQSDYFQRSLNQLVLPDYLIGDRWFLDRLREFDGIPTAAGDGKFEQGGSLPERLESIAGIIEFSSLSLSPEEKTEVRDAQKVLYFDFLNLIPSEAYIAYSKYKDQYDQANSELSGAPTQQRPLILGRMRQIERDWTLFGHRSDVDSALSILQKYQTGNAAASSKEWLSSLPDSASTNAAPLADAFQRTDWIKVTKADDTIRKRGSLTVGQSVSDVPALSRLSLEFQIVKVNRPALQNAFLADRTWRLKNGEVLSGGANALVPRYISSLLLVRNVEMVFDAEIKQASFAGVANSPTVSIDNLTVRSDNRGCLVYQAKYFRSCTTSILGYVVSHLPLIPNPDPNRTFKAN
jgi:hypothetical protein